MANNEYGHPRIVSPSVELHWAGWVSTTDKLQRNGWQLAAHEEPLDGRYSLALKHPEIGCFGYAENILHDYMQGMYEYRMAKMMEVRMRLERNFQFAGYSDMQSQFIPIDAMPRYEMVMDYQNLDEMNIFRKNNTKSKEFYLEQASMDQILELALKKQAPTQDEIRERILREKDLANMRRQSDPIAELRLVA